MLEVSTVYLVEGRNGYFAVDEYRGQGTSAAPTRLMRGPVFTGTRKAANAVAEELNSAYARGHRDGMADAYELSALGAAELAAIVRSAR